MRKPCIILKLRLAKKVRYTMKERTLLYKCSGPHGITKANIKTHDREKLIKRDFSTYEPLTNITEVHCKNIKLYIPPILDCFDWAIVALEMRDNIKKELCIDTVKQLCLSFGIHKIQLYTATEEVNTQSKPIKKSLRKLVWYKV